MGTFDHWCKYTIDGCQVRLLLTEVTTHEMICDYGKIKCPWCRKKVPMIKFSSHNDDCFTNDDENIWHSLTRCTMPWDGKSPVVYTIPNVRFQPSVVLWKNTKFYSMLRRYDHKERFIFYTGIEGSDEGMSKYIVKYYLKNVKTGEMDCVTLSDVDPVDIIGNIGKVVKTRSYGSVSDKMMKRYYNLDRNGDIEFFLKIEIEE